LTGSESKIHRFDQPTEAEYWLSIAFKNYYMVKNLSELSISKFLRTLFNQSFALLNYKTKEFSRGWVW